MRENFTILKQRAALGATHVPVNFLQFRVPVPCLAAILDCRMIHGILRYFKKRFLNDYLLEKDRPYNLRKFKEFGMSFSKIGRDVVRNTMRLEIEMRRGHFVDTCTTLQREAGATIYWRTYSHSVWSIIRDFRFRSWIWENFLTLWNFKAGKSTSRLKCVQRQQILISQCSGSEKLRQQNQLTILRHRNRLQGEEISLIMFCLMR